MELKEFVKKALIDICEAVHEAKMQVKDKVAIAPARIDELYVEREQLVEFEVLVSATDSKSGQGDGKIQVIAFSSNLEGKIENQKQESNKIKFQVPLFYSAVFPR